MTPASRIQAILEILSNIDKARVPMDTVTGDYFRNRRYIGGKDRAYVAEGVYDIMRMGARLSWHLERCGVTEPTPRQVVLAWMALPQAKPHEHIVSIFDGSKYAPEALTKEEDMLTVSLCRRTFDDPAMPEATRVECPPDLEATLRARFGADFADELTALIPPATLDLRVNSWLSDRDTVLKALHKDRVHCEETRWSPVGLRVQGRAFLSKTKAFIKGWIEIQDEASQIAALLCNAKPGQQVLDFCAGAGGKTLALAAMMRNKGRIVACDNDPRRLEKARPRLRRAGLHDIVEIRPLEDEKNRKWLRRQKQCFDVVLTDVPCTGTGTWRRNPDMRWYHYGPGLEDLRPVQAEILDKAAPLVKAGGRLVYATCSVLPEEDEQQIEAFLARNADFRLVAVEEAWPLDSAPPCTGSYLRLTPRQHGTDGFFAAVMERKAEPPPKQIAATNDTPDESQED